MIGARRPQYPPWYWGLVSPRPVPRPSDRRARRRKVPAAMNRNVMMLLVGVALGYLVLPKVI